jgi:tetratricopeptide (TPR) repeat protein
MRTKTAQLLTWAILFFALPPCYSQTNASREQQIESHQRQAAEYLKENRADLAVEEFKAIVALDPNNVDARGNLGAVLYFQGKYAEAIPELRAAVKLRPKLWKTRALLGMAEKEAGDIGAARGDLEKAFPNLAEEKVRVQAGLELIEIYSAADDLDKAAATVGVLRELEPTNETVLYTAYRVYSNLANETLLSLSVVAPNSALMHQAIAHELAKRGNAAAAIENYRAALKINPQLPGLHFELAEMLSTVDTAEARAEAESEYKAALDVNPYDEQAECRLGDIAARRNDLNDAQQRFARAIELQPGDPEAKIGMAKVLMAMGQPEKAETLLEQALQLDPTSSVAHFRLSTVYRQLGRSADAKHEIEEYQKYKAMKEKLQDLYHDLHLQPAGDEAEEPTPSR